MPPAQPPTDPVGEQREHSPYDPLLAFETILEHSPLNVTIFDGNYIVRNISKSAAKLMGMSRKQMLGRSLLEDLPPLLHADLARTLAGESMDGQGRVPSELGEQETWTRVLTLPIRDRAGTVQAGMVIATDISERKRANELAERLAFFDPVTDLPNRAMFTIMLERALFGSQGKRHQLALAWLNLDRFKDVNDALGQTAGDRLLRAVGDRLRDHARTIDVVARAGGDDFLLLLPRITSRAHVERLMARIHEVFVAPFVDGDEAIFLTASCGVALHPDGGSRTRELLENGHTAMRAAKEAGGDTCHLFVSQVAEDSSERLRLAAEIRRSIEQDCFTLHYQPTIHLGTMSVQSVEALARWEHPERGLVWPAEFMPFAEESGLIVPLGRKLLAQACGHLRAWHDSLAEPPRLAINVSAREFQRTDVCGEVIRAAAAVGLEPSFVEVEITETAVLAKPGRAAEVAACLRDAGATVALGDFGTGYSSLTHLRELPIDRVKIDRSFVASCLTDRSASAILVAITHLAHDLGLEVVAEGVETPAQLEFVRAVGCDAAQGHDLARPLSLEGCTEYLLRASGGTVA
jgi:diguanylate cyclase (GGDEF)-like protein/PAS domain S-box-containing protein